MNREELLIKRFGSTKIATRTIEDIVLKQLALQSLVGGNGSGSGTGYIPFYDLMPSGIILTELGWNHNNPDGNSIDHDVFGALPTVEVNGDVTVNPLQIFPNGEFHGCDNLIIEAELKIVSIGAENNPAIGLGIISKTVTNFANRAFIQMINGADSHIYAENTGTVVPKEIPDFELTENSVYNLRFEKRGSNFFFSITKDKSELSAINYIQPLMFGPTTSPDASNATARHTMTIGHPCIVLNDVLVEVRKFTVYTQTPSSSVMLMGDDVLQGFRIPFKDTAASILSTYLPISSCFSFSGKSQHLAQNADMDLMYLHPKAAIIWTGANDKIANVPQETIEDNYLMIVSKLIAIGCWPVRILLPPNAAILNSSIIALNDAFLDPVYSDYPVIDLWNSKLSTDPDDAFNNAPNPTYFEADLWHLNAAGHQYVADLIADAIANIDFETKPPEL